MFMPIWFMWLLSVLKKNIIIWIEDYKHSLTVLLDIGENTKDFELQYKQNEIGLLLKNLEGPNES